MNYKFFLATSLLLGSTAYAMESDPNQKLHRRCPICSCQDILTVASEIGTAIASGITCFAKAFTCHDHEIQALITWEAMTKKRLDESENQLRHDQETGFTPSAREKLDILKHERALSAIVFSIAYREKANGDNWASAL